MRKRLKVKKRSCWLCKPHKLGNDNRWKPKQEFLLKIAEREIKQYEGKSSTHE